MSISLVWWGGGLFPCKNKGRSRFRGVAKSACVAQVVYESPVGYAEEMNAVDQALQRQAEKDPDYFGPTAQAIHS